MKAGDRFLNDCGYGKFNSYVLLEACGFWFLLNEKYGSIWCSPQNNLTPISAFGGEKWHDSFRKIPKIIFNRHTYEEGDSSYEILYALHEDGREVNVTVDCGGATEKEYLLEYNHSLNFEDLEPID